MIFFYVNYKLLIPILWTRANWLYIVGLLAFLSISQLLYVISPAEEWLLGGTNIRTKLSFLINFTLFIIMSWMYWYFKEYQYKRRKLLVVENERLKLELSSLRTQVSPHFLFNALNNIYSLVQSNNENSLLYIEKTSNVLRFINDNVDKEAIPVEEEVNFLSDYITIQKLKLVSKNDRIKFNYEKRNSSFEIMPLILFNYIENAFKHGNLSYSKDGFIDIEIIVLDHKLTLKILNSYVHKEIEIREGTGNKNMLKQLDLIYPNKYKLETNQLEGTYSLKLTIIK
jgi:LytS/YehU family sensor histidine kinase